MDISRLWSLDWVRAVQALGPWLGTPMVLLTFFGGEQFFLLIVPLFFWCINKQAGRDLAILLMASSFVNFTIKSFLKEPRPFWLDPAVGLTSATSFSFPSGHAQASALVFGALAYLVLRAGWPPLRRALVAVMLGLLVFLVAFSRVYLGAHFPGDTLAGILVGLLVLAAFIWLRPLLGPRLAALPARTHVALAVLAGAIILGLGLLGLAANIPVWPAEAGLVAEGRIAALREAAMLTGLVPGLWLGFVWEGRYVRFAVKGAWWQLALRYLFGGATMLGLYLGTRALMMLLPLTLDVPLRIAQFALIAFWAVAIWPWILVRAGLAKRQETAPPAA